LQFQALFVHTILFYVCRFYRDRTEQRNANSTLRPVLADVSMNGTLYSCANRSPSSRLTARSVPQSDLLPTV